MLGHGSPYNAFMRRVLRMDGLDLRLLQVAAFLLCAIAGFSREAVGREADLQLRITWGGGSERQTWQGAVRLSRGRILGARRLGLESDLPGSMEVQPQVVEFWEQTPTAFDGLDLHLIADSSDELIIELAAKAQRPTTVVLPVESFLTEDGFLHNKVFDEHQNRLLVRRVSGDELRVEFRHPSLVFSPGEQASFQVLPKHLPLAPGTAVRCTARLVDEAERERWSETQNRELDSNGSAAPIPLSFEIPAQEGVYSVQVELQQSRGFGAALIRQRPKPVAQRSVQLVVVADQRGVSITPDNSAWETVTEVDLTDPSWLEQWNWLPQIPWRNDGRPIGNAPLEEVAHQNEKYFELAGQSWYAIPLPIAKVGAPHQVEVEFPSDYPQTVGLSIMEPNAAGVASPPYLDSGFNVPKFPPAESYKPQKHRFVFWPRSESPWLLITNRRGTPAVFRSLRVLSGPESLPAAAISDSTNSRLLSVYYDKPLFAQNFTAVEALESATKPARSLNDWNTFYTGGKRLVEYLRHVGYNAAMISVLRDGSTIYPSRVLQPTPRYDNGTFFVTGQDPVPKDGLEMLFRLFDNAGLQLIPALHLSTPLPELERQLRGPGNVTEGIELKNATGKSYIALYGTRRGLAPYYNPLDERVQDAIGQVVEEVVRRYGHHPSFKGICLQLSPESYLQLPDEEWGQDPRTWSRFLQERGPLPDGESSDAATRKAWLNWRAEVIANAHTRWSDLIAGRRPDARLYLAMADSLAGPVIQREMKPRLLARGNFANAMLRLGIDSKLYRTDRVVLLRPRRLSPILSLSKQAADFEINRSRSVDEFFYHSAAPGALNYHVPLNLRLSEFDAASPFGPTSTTTWISAHIPDSGDFARASFTNSLATADLQSVVTGGWMLPLGQEDATRDIVASYRSLPPQRFDTVTPKQPGLAASSVVVRSLTLAGQTFCYVLNNGPWSVDVNVEMTSGRGFQARTLGRPGAPHVLEQGNSRLWKVSLRPFDLQAIGCLGEGVQVRTWEMEYSPQGKESLAQLLNDVSVRNTQLSNPEPLQVLDNPHFEQPSAAGEIPGWRVDQLSEIQATTEVDPVDPEKRQALRLRMSVPQNRIAWVRSEEFRVRGTGRIAVRTWVRGARGEQQPSLRVVIAVLAPGRKPREFPSNFVPHRLTEQWEELRFNPPDLPVDEETTVAIGFDVTGTGEIWIDDVEVFDLYFEDKERDVLDRTFAPAPYIIREGKFAECQQILNGFWPRYLLELVPSPASQRLAIRPDAPAASVPANSAAEQESSSWERFVPSLPRLRLPFGNEE